MIGIRNVCRPIQKVRIDRRFITDGSEFLRVDGRRDHPVGCPPVFVIYSASRPRHFLRLVIFGRCILFHRDRNNVLADNKSVAVA